ncbi:MAG: beta-propeller fold lactonase family protein, partial [Nitrospirae bacterium]|nr:beta-propeller fold lactonase family protein [Candidatus Manganitrophaceae bacterium]
MRSHIETTRYVFPKGKVLLKTSLVISSFFLLLSLSACGNTSAEPEAGGSTQTVSDKTLYVTNGNGGKLLAFDVRVLGKTLTVQGENIPPTRQFPDTVSSPAGIFLDRENDTLYVANPGQNAIQIYDDASTLITPLKASRIISGSSTELDEPFGLTFDATSNRLFVANKNGNSIVAFCLGQSPNSGNLA